MKNILFAKKPIGNVDEHSGLKRNLTATNLIMLGVGGIIGAGIFVLTGSTAANYAGPAVVLSFIVAAVGCGFAGLCYAEFASMIPVAGSAYAYAYATLGEFLAWIIGWDLIIEYLFAASTVSVGWSGYATSLLSNIGIHLPAALSNAPVGWSPETGITMTGAIVNLPAIFIVVALSALLIVGISESAKTNLFFVITKITVILIFLMICVSYVKVENYTPFIPENKGEFGAFGISGILRGAGVIFFAYIGFDCVSTTAQEAKNPSRDMPIGIIGSLIICTLLYIFVSLVLTGIVSYTELNVPAPVAFAIDRAGISEKYSWLAIVIKIGALAGLTSVVLVMLMGQPRIFYAMSKDGLLPAFFSKVHPKFGTPYVGTIITGVLASIMAGILPIGLLGELVSIGTLLAFAIVCASVWVLRYTNPELPRPFKVPGVAFVAIGGIVTTLGMMATLAFDTWIRLIVWLAIGFVIYFAYGIKRSKLRVK